MESEEQVSYKPNDLVNTKLKIDKKIQNTTVIQFSNVHKQKKKNGAKVSKLKHLVSGFDLDLCYRR